jgi:hypothetical protein
MFVIGTECVNPMLLSLDEPIHVFDGFENFKHEGSLAVFVPSELEKPTMMLVGQELFFVEQPSSGDMDRRSDIHAPVHGIAYPVNARDGGISHVALRAMWSGADGGRQLVIGPAL